MKGKALLEPKQKRSIATKSKIKNTARVLFAELGYYKVTSNMIASAAKVPIGSFYNYFGNKKGLILELVQDWNDQYHDATFDQFSNVLEQLNQVADVYKGIERLLVIFALSTHFADPFFKIIHSLQFTEEDVLNLSEEIRTTEMRLVEEFLEKINSFHPIRNIPIKAKLIHSTGENITLYIHHLGTSFEKEELLSETAKMLTAYLMSHESP